MVKSIPRRWGKIRKQKNIIGNIKMLLNDTDLIIIPFKLKVVTIKKLKINNNKYLKFVQVAVITAIYKTD